MEGGRLMRLEKIFELTKIGDELKGVKPKAERMKEKEESRIKAKQDYKLR